jgi:hypothetical protein
LAINAQGTTTAHDDDDDDDDNNNNNKEKLLKFKARDNCFWANLKGIVDTYYSI